MKCDELEEWYAGQFSPSAKVFGALDVTEAIAELKAENERLKDELDAANNQCENLINSATDIMLRQDKVNDAKRDEIESLKTMHYAEMVDAGMRERRLKRALYKALANWAKCEERINNRDAYEASEYLPSAEDKFRNRANRWREMETKCRAKVEGCR